MTGSRYRLEAAGRILVSQLSDEDAALFDGNSQGTKSTREGVIRFGEYVGGLGLVKLVTDDPDLVASRRKFDMRIKAVYDTIPVVSEIASSAEDRFLAKSRRLIHNLTSLNGHMIQDIYSVISQDRLAGNVRRSVPLIEEEMKGKKSSAFAKAFLSLAKHSAAMKNEFAVFRKSENIDEDVDLKVHNLHKVVMNAAYLFFSDFADIDGFINVRPAVLRARADYEFAFVALYHIFDNAAKYICRGTNLDVSISQSEDSVRVEFDMCSLVIQPEESAKLVLEGFSGEWPKKLSRNGNGVGLSVVNRVMQMQGGRLEIQSDPGSRKELHGAQYQRNRFVLHFPCA